MNKSFSQKISDDETRIRNLDSTEYAKMMEFSFQYVNEIDSMLSYRRENILKKQEAEGKMILNSDTQAILRILELPEINQIIKLLSLLPEKEKKNLAAYVQARISDSLSTPDAIQTFKDGEIPWDEVKSNLIKMIDSHASHTSHVSSYVKKLKKLLPRVFLTLSATFVPIASEKIIDNIWPDDSTQEIQRLLQEQNDLDRERIKIDRERIRIDQEILATIKSNSAKNLSGSADASALTQITKENTQFQQAQTDNQMDISEVQLK